MTKKCRYGCNKKIELVFEMTQNGGRWMVYDMDSTNAHRCVIARQPDQARLAKQDRTITEKLPYKD